MLSPKNLWPVANLRRVSVVQHNAAETSEQQGVLGVAQSRCGGRPHRDYRQAVPRDGELGHGGAVLDGLPGTTKVPEGDFGDLRVWGYRVSPINATHSDGGSPRWPSSRFCVSRMSAPFTLSRTSTQFAPPSEYVLLCHVGLLVFIDQLPVLIPQA